MKYCRHYRAHRHSIKELTGHLLCDQDLKEIERFTIRGVVETTMHSLLYVNRPSQQGQTWFNRHAHTNPTLPTNPPTHLRTYLPIDLPTYQQNSRQTQLSTCLHIRFNSGSVMMGVIFGVPKTYRAKFLHDSITAYDSNQLHKVIRLLSKSAFCLMKQKLRLHRNLLTKNL